MNTDLFNNPVPSLVESKPKGRKGQQLHCIEPEIKSISFSQDEILRSIHTLYVPGGFEVDATYGYGGFYNTLPRPEHCFDIDPKKPEAVKADSRALPLLSSSVKSVMFDPPFVVTNHVESDEYLMGKKYGGYRSITQLREHYNSSLVEFARILKPNGICVFKCQDFVHGRCNYFIHDEVLSLARAAGFKAVDLFILFARNRFKGGLKKQNHARKFHSYFWVFRKERKKAS